MKMTIAGWLDGQVIPVRFTQAAPGVAPGGGVSPHIRWSSPPVDTQSFMLHMHDMDVSRNMTTEDQIHWLVWNIPGSLDNLPEGVPPGLERPDGSYQISVTGPMYRGPGAPADGPFHHYIFEVYALDTKLHVTPLTDAFETRANVIQAIQGHILAKALYGGLFRWPDPER
jgi:Raf kinase inhibitor-like YbhB/YbcL family protein